MDNPLSSNRYTHVSNNPLRSTDPSRHWQKGDEKLPETARKEISRLSDEWENAKMTTVTDSTGKTKTYVYDKNNLMTQQAEDASNKIESVKNFV